MTMQDPVADLLTRVRNAQTAGHAEVRAPHSNLKEAVCRVLQEEGYVAGYAVEGDAQRQLVVQLKYHHGEPVIEEIKRVSRPGLRNYQGAEDIPSVRGGLGIAIVSTSRGVMTDRAARAAGVGGEVICTVF